MLPKILIYALLLWKWCFDQCCDILYYLIYESEYDKIKNLPPMRDGSSILMESATALAAKIRNQESGYSSEALVKACIERIKKVNGTLNAVVDTRFDEALKEAVTADKLVARTIKESGNPLKTGYALQRLAMDKPLLGVPFTTKDCFSVEGLSHTTGLLSRGKRNEKGSFYAEPIKRIRDAGAIPIAVTNVPELCMWMETSNRIYGRTVNPYHPGRICGGSSGGEGSIIGSGASIFGIGSDVGGSIRMPCFFNGIFGHKPSWGIVPNGPGQLPNAYGEVDKFLVTGPMCRYACDLLPIFNALAKPEKLPLLRLSEPVDLKSLKLYYMSDNAGGYLETPVHPDLKNVQMDLINALEQELGIKAKKVELRHFHHSFMIWSNMMQTEPVQPSFGQELNEASVDGDSINPYKELLKWFACKTSDHTFPAIGLAIMEKFVSVDDPIHHKCLKKCQELKKELDSLLGDDGVLIYPSHPTPAPYHGLPLLRPFNPGYTAIFNVLGNPVTQVPLGLGSWNVPLGVQLVSGVNQDRNCLALALLVEKLFGGWVEPMARK